MTNQKPTSPARQALTPSRTLFRSVHPSNRIHGVTAARILQAVTTHHQAAYDPGEPFPTAHITELGRVAIRASQLHTITQPERQTIRTIIDEATSPF